MIKSYALITALLLMVVFLVSLWWVSAQLAGERAMVATYKRELQQMGTRLKQVQSVAAVQAAYTTRLRTDLAEARRAEQEALEAVGHEQALPDYLRRIVDGLRSGNNTNGLHGPTSAGGLPAAGNR